MSDRHPSWVVVVAVVVVVIFHVLLPFNRYEIRETEQGSDKIKKRLALQSSVIIMSPPRAARDIHLDGPHVLAFLSFLHILLSLSTQVQKDKWGSDKIKNSSFLTLLS